MDTPEETTTNDVYGPRFKHLDAIVRGLHDAALEGLNPKTSAAAKELSGGVAVAHIINLLGYSVVALTEIAEAQTRIADIVAADFANNHPPEPVNPNAKIERNPIGKRRSPLTPPD